MNQNLQPINLPTNINLGNLPTPNPRINIPQHPTSMNGPVLDELKNTRLLNQKQLDELVAARQELADVRQELDVANITISEMSLVVAEASRPKPWYKRLTKQVWGIVGAIIGSVASAIIVANLDQIQAFFSRLFEL